MEVDNKVLFEQLELFKRGTIANQKLSVLLDVPIRTIFKAEILFSFEHGVMVRIISSEGQAVSFGPEAISLIMAYLRDNYRPTLEEFAKNIKKQCQEVVEAVTTELGLES